MNKADDNVKCANMTSNENFEIRANVKFCQFMDDTPFSTFESIKLMKGENSVSKSLVFRWHERLKWTLRTREQKGKVGEE